MLHGSIKLFGWPLGTPVPTGTWPLWFAGLIEFVLGLLIVVAHAVTLAWSRRRYRVDRGFVLGWLVAVAVTLIVVSPVAGGPHRSTLSRVGFGSQWDRL